MLVRPEKAALFSTLGQWLLPEKAELFSTLGQLLAATGEKSAVVCNVIMYVCNALSAAVLLFELATILDGFAVTLAAMASSVAFRLAGAGELRLVRDGHSYTRDEFLIWFGEESGMRQWQNAPRVVRSGDSADTDTSGHPALFPLAWPTQVDAGTQEVELFSRPTPDMPMFDEANEDEIRSDHYDWMWQQALAEYQEQYERDHEAQRKAELFSKTTRRCTFSTARIPKRTSSGCTGPLGSRKPCPRSTSSSSSD